MADFNEHLKQAKRNLDFLKGININQNDHWDWQVTVCFYVAVHLVNAHIARKGNLHYRSHADVSNSINPYNLTAPCKIPESIYLCFEKLRGLSRRSRYLCHDDTNQDPGRAHLTFDKHLRRAIQKLDELMGYFAKEYSITFDVIEIDCIELKKLSLTYFKFKNAPSAKPLPKV